MKGQIDMEQKKFNNKGQAIYFSHGGGPLPLLHDPSHDKMVEFMKKLSSNISRPDSIVVFSAHWEEPVVTIQSSDEPELIYDYYGFPEEAYAIDYPCKGNPDLAKKIANLLKAAQIECVLDDQRPYDHGSYIPLKLMYPEADIPVIQVSLNHDLDALTHLKIGKALGPLMDENVLIIGSGFSFHNMREYDFSGRNAEDPKNNVFQERLIKLCCEEKDEAKKWKHGSDWENFPEARYCHPREEHLIPLFVCLGVSQNVGTKIFDDYIAGKRATAFYWGVE